MNSPQEKNVYRVTKKSLIDGENMKQRIRTTTIICLTLLGITMLPLRASAEAADKDKPIELEADEVTVNDAKQTSTYTGNVILTQGTLEIHADKLIVRQDAQGFQHSTSYGKPTTFKQKMEGRDEYIYGEGRRIEYDGRMDKVQLHIKASVKRGEDVVYGNFISYDANAEFAHVIGGKKSADGSRGSGRVKAIIQPKKQQSKPIINNSSGRISRTLN